jgi:hypothetical protein
LFGQVPKTRKTLEKPQKKYGDVSRIVAVENTRDERLLSVLGRRDALQIMREQDRTFYVAFASARI